MKYQSTRGDSTSGFSFQDVVLKGYAPDGGMYMPMEIPKLTPEVITSWSALSYQDIVKEVAKIYIAEEIAAHQIDAIIDRGFETFANPAEPIATKNLKGDFTMLEMFHGKSLAFKDLSMCCTAEFLRHFLEERQSRAVLLIATSGDTGSSALEAIKALERVDTVVLLPKNRTSEIQELQMTTVVSDNVHVVRADGTSDDTDVPIKKVFCDSEFAQRHHLGTLNSVNWGRMMVQIAHHFYAYFQGKLRGEEKESLVFVPSGGLGNCTAACIAHEMGLPIRLVCAVTNDALYRTVYEDDYSLSEVNVSIAPAMNVQAIYNFERIVYVLSGMDTAMVRRVQEEYEVQGKTTVPSEVLNKLRSFIEVAKVTDDEILDAMRRCYEENSGYAICPHTATGLAAAYRYAGKDAYNIVLLGVASPAKFSSTLDKAGIAWTGRDMLGELRNKEVRYTDWEATDDWFSKLQELVESIAESHTSAE